MVNSWKEKNVSGSVNSLNTDILADIELTPVGNSPNHENGSLSPQKKQVDKNHKKSYKKSNTFGQNPNSKKLLNSNFLDTENIASCELHFMNFENFSRTTMRSWDLDKLDSKREPLSSNLSNKAIANLSPNPSSMTIRLPEKKGFFNNIYNFGMASKILASSKNYKSEFKETLVRHHLSLIPVEESISESNSETESNIFTTNQSILSTKGETDLIDINRLNNAKYMTQSIPYNMENYMNRNAGYYEKKTMPIFKKPIDIVDYRKNSDQSNEHAIKNDFSKWRRRVSEKIPRNLFLANTDYNPKKSVTDKYGNKKLISSMSTIKNNYVNGFGSGTAQ